MITTIEPTYLSSHTVTIVCVCVCVVKILKIYFSPDF